MLEIIWPGLAMAHRPFTASQARQNRAFLEALRRTGNPRLAADLLGVHRSTYMKRRAKCPAFAQSWDAEVAAAHADFHEDGGPSAPSVRPERSRGAQQRPTLRTNGGELVVGRTRNGRLQLRRAPKGWMSKAGEQAFLSALSATANVRLSAAAAGFAHSGFYNKRRDRAAFAREMRWALECGYEGVEGALYAAGLVDSHEDDAWRRNDPPPVPPMTVDQALQLVHLHEKSVTRARDRERRRRGESEDAYVARLRAEWEAEKALEAEDAGRAAALAAEYERDPPDEQDEADLPALPMLDQVTGWSKADPDKTPHDPDKALFGGWRLEDWKKRARE
jgi:hypothetical protein